MDQIQQRRAQRAALRKRKKQQQAAGCLFLSALVVLLGICLAIFHTFGGRLPDWSTGIEDNPYGPADFARMDGYLTCTAGPTRMGIDVSEYQGTIDWDTVRGEGFDFAFIRIGFRGYETGEIKADDRGMENLRAAREAGFDVGVYFYAQAISAEEARQEAQWCLNWLDGFDLELPVVYDWEYVSADARTGWMGREEVTACFSAFCETIEQGGYRSMVYFNPHVAGDLLDLQALADSPWWLAQYRDGMDFPYKVQFWQYTEEGTVPGIQGKVDINLMFLE